MPAFAEATMPLGEVMNIAIASFKLAKVRFALTTFGMIVGTASLILVVTIGLTGKQYILDQIQAIGANMVYASYEASGSESATPSQQDFLTIDDLRAVRMEVPAIHAASPMLELHDRIAIQGRERELRILGVDPEYRIVRNLVITAGRFFDQEDAMARYKVAMITPELAERLYGSSNRGVGERIRIKGLPFVVVGLFKEKVETFGQSEVSDDTILIPYSVARYFTETDAVKLIFFSISDSSQVQTATERIQAVIQSRHRPESAYRVRNLTELLSVAERTSNALTIILLLIGVVTLIVSGVGIMNIMLSSVQERTREIGIRKALGATSREIRLQFLTEAVLIALIGGVLGTVIGIAIPLSVGFLTDYRIPVSGLSVTVAIGVASAVGIIFGTAPAMHAAEINPVDSLRYE